MYSLLKAFFPLSVLIGGFDAYQYPVGATPSHMLRIARTPRAVSWVNARGQSGEQAVNVGWATRGIHPCRCSEETRDSRALTTYSVVHKG